MTAENLLIAINELNKNVHKEISEMKSLKAEIKATREVEKENKIFLEKLVISLLDKQQEQAKSTWSLLKEVLLWTTRIATVVLLAALGIKIVFPDMFGG